MDARRLAPTIGALACALLVGAVVVPYLFLPVGAVGTYYGTGAITPLAAGLLAVVGGIAFAAGREGRADPVMVAGAGLVLGLFMAVVAILWAVTVPRGVVSQLSSSILVGYHRILLAAFAVVVPLAGVWYARALGVV